MVSHLVKMFTSCKDIKVTKFYAFIHANILVANELKAAPPPQKLGSAVKTWKVRLKTVNEKREERKQQKFKIQNSHCCK